MSNVEKIELTDVKVHADDNAGPSGVSRRLSTVSKSLKVEQKSFLFAWIDQLFIMLKRNTILQIRYRNSTLSQAVLAPLLFHLILFILQQADYANQRKSNLNPPIGALDGVRPCRGFNGRNCILFMYTPVTAETTAYMNKFATLNKKRTGETINVATEPINSLSYLPTSSDANTIYPVPSQDFIYNYALNNPNLTRWAVTFDTKNPGAANVNVRYQVWFNASLTANVSDIFGRELLSVVRGLDESIITNLNGGNKDANLDIQMKDWPLIPATTVSDSIVQSLGPVFFFCSVMVIFINVLNQIVSEKEAKLRLGMEMMGLKPSVYWVSHYLSTTLLVFINSFLTVIFGLMFGFSAFRNANFGVLWLSFFLFGGAMVMFAFFLTTFVRQAKVAVLLGIFLFVIGLLFESFVFSSGQLGYIWYKDTIITPTVWQSLIHIPFFNFGRMFLDITTLTTGRLDSLTQTFIPGPGFPWSQLYQKLPDEILPLYDGGYPTPTYPISQLAYMLMNVGVYAVLLWFFDNVIPNEYGSSQYPWFFVLPSYWGYTSSTKQAEDAWIKLVQKQKSAAVDADEDPDVTVERGVTFTPENGGSVKIANLRKTYPGPIFGRGKGKVAVKNTCLNLEEGKLLALLGQNGAGKSTTMTTRRWGRIRRLLGVCPQHDILFDDLTAKEHIELYAGLKGVPKKYWPELFEERLKAVKLWTVKNVQAGTYSEGDMKRRLSLLISTIGDPRVIFMDEPTTGMDPVNRRHVWSFVEKFKKDRVIVLTTHSMEEADVLGDRIAIMAHGRMRALGNAISLKAKYGAGYRIRCDYECGRSRQEQGCGDGTECQFPLASTPAIPAFVKWLEENPLGAVKAWGISQTTLEEGF
ncbi:hypothetical protein BC829DRAFT_404623 [Chytridium lagenaria]|nr:hypothetical protein BC829DRAFT_404623 [Chytridium lagenaria]